MSIAIGITILLVVFQLVVSLKLKNTPVDRSIYNITLLTLLLWQLFVFIFVV